MQRLAELRVTQTARVLTWTGSLNRRCATKRRISFAAKGETPADLVGRGEKPYRPRGLGGVTAGGGLAIQTYCADYQETELPLQ